MGRGTRGGEEREGKGMYKELYTIYQPTTMNVINTCGKLALRNIKG